MMHVATSRVVVDVLALPNAEYLRRPDLLNALRAWKRPLRGAVLGLEIGERVRFALAPDVWRFGRVVEWEPTEDLGAQVMARVAVERQSDADPVEVRRQRVNLMPVPEAAHAAP